MVAFAHMSRNTLGAIAAVTSSLCFSVNDATVKFMSGDFSLPQMMFLRSIIAIAVILFVLAPFERQKLSLRGSRKGVLIVRGLLMVLANLFFFLGIAILPIADTVGIFFICPLMILAMSVVFLGETAGPRRWSAVGIGLIGVLIMLRPGGEGFQIAFLLPLIAAACYAILQVMTRAIGDAVTATTMSLYLQLTFFVVMGAMGIAFGAGQYDGMGGELFAFLLRPWIWPVMSDLPLFLIIGVATAGSNYFVSQAYRLGEASLVAPLEYVALPMGVMFGVVIFGDWPSVNSWVGMILIVGAGLFVVWRESLAAQSPDRHPPRPQ